VHGGYCKINVLPGFDTGKENQEIELRKLILYGKI
jgi:hypothetical protein